MALVTDPGEELLARVQDLQAQVAEAGDPRTQALADELVASVIDLYGSGLERVVARLHADGEDGLRIARELAQDPIVATLLLIHDLHPVPLRERVQQALEEVRPYMESHGGNVELLSLEEGVARIRLQGSCSSCQASTVTLELAIKRALDEAAPDLERLEVEGVQAPVAGTALPMAAAPQPSGATLPVIVSSPGRAGAEAGAPGEDGEAGAGWRELDGLDALAAGEMRVQALPGLELLVANVDGTLLAYRDVCPGCGGSLHEGTLDHGALACARCGRTYLLPRAGRSLDGEGLQLAPVPLLREHDRVRVAVA